MQNLTGKTIVITGASSGIGEVTALEHIHLFLIYEAKNLLLNPDLSVTEAAYKLGFEYPQYFSRLFKKKVGVSPTKYIEQFSKN